MPDTLDSHRLLTIVDQLLYLHHHYCILSCTAMLALLLSAEPSELWGDASLDVANAFDDGTSGRIQSIRVHVLLYICLHTSTVHWCSHAHVHTTTAISANVLLQTIVHCYCYYCEVYYSDCGALFLQHVDSNLQIRSVKSHVVSVEVDYTGHTGSMAFSQKHGNTSNKYKTKPWWQLGTKATEQVLTLREGQHLVSISGTYKADKIGKPVLIRHVQFTDNSKRVHGPYGNAVANAIELNQERVATAEELVTGCQFKYTPGDDGIIRSFRGHDAAIGLAAIGVNYSLACKQHDVVASSSSSNNNNATSTTTPSLTATAAAATTAAAPPSATSSDEQQQQQMKQQQTATSSETPTPDAPTAISEAITSVGTPVGLAVVSAADQVPQQDKRATTRCNEALTQQIPSLAYARQQIPSEMCPKIM
eukprot:744-Heterococcus_DN1.PRE.6